MTAATPPEARPRWDASPGVDLAVEALLANLSLDDKVALVSGQLAVFDDGTQPQLPDGLPALALADGPAGLRLANPTLPDHRATALPAPIALAATWDPDLAARYGDVIGAEAAATGHNIFLGPAVDIARAPWAGRTFESFGEDPLLQSRLVAPEVRALQAHGVVACIKHFILNNQEHQRSTIDVVAGERTLQEVYLPPFAAAIQEGGAGSVMGSYNRIDGVHACANPHLLTGILREQLGFRGFVMSDFFANPETVASAQAGLDWELGLKEWGPKLTVAVQSGALDPAVLDEMVRRILRPVLGLGLAEPQERRPIPADEHGDVALAVAEQAVVLLKNDGALLPLDPAALRTVAVIGPDADNVSAAGGGSATVQPARPTSVPDALRRRLGDGVAVTYAPGVDPVGPGALLPGLPALPAALLTPVFVGRDSFPLSVPGHVKASHAEPGQAEPQGLWVEYWDNPTFTGDPVAARLEPTPELNFGFFDLHPGLSAASPKLPRKPAGLSGPIAVRWTGAFTPPASGEYTLSLTCLGTARVTLGGRVVLDSTAPDAVLTSPTRLPFGPPPGIPATQVRQVEATLRLEAGQSLPLEITYAADAPGFRVFGEALLRLGWRPPAGIVSPSIAAAAQVAAASDVAIVVARTYETEEMDRPSLRLPNGQDELIRAVAAANPRTVVVLMNAGPVETASWELGVPAIVEAWFAGQEQGPAVAGVLCGDVNPSGRLPLSFPRDDGQTPLATPEQYPGVDGRVHYSEGTDVGYRGYERLGLTPQYWFGHGLGYTTFAYSDLAVGRDGMAGQLQVMFTLRNAGERAGTETAQVYLASPAWGGSKRLAGWARVTLAPGEQRRVTIGVEPPRVWSEAKHGWAAVAGECEVAVGASAGDVRLSALR